MCHRVLSGATVTLETPQWIGTSGSIQKKKFSCESNLIYSSRHIECVLPFPDTFSYSGILPTKVQFILNARMCTTFTYTEDLQCLMFIGPCIIVIVEE